MTLTEDTLPPQPAGEVPTQPLSEGSSPTPADAEGSVAEPTFPVLAVQFFLVPMLIVLTCVGLYAGVRWMMGEERGMHGLLDELHGEKGNRKWQAAFELSRQLALDRQAGTPVPAEVTERLLQEFKESRGGEPPLRRFLALALGNLKDPRATELLIDAIGHPDPGDANNSLLIGALLALGNIGDARAVPAAVGLAKNEDPGVRKAVYYTLGIYGEASAIPVLEAGVKDGCDDVRWNAALALARMKHPGGVAVLREMLDRESLAKVTARDEDNQPTLLLEANLEDVMVNALSGVACLGSRDLEPLVEKLSKNDKSLKVRRAALAALESLRGAK
ncbi:MAG: HEAT repeat domain-containing protein [Planctomycetes bacterium]|nr:HEAT repeat domain-containing protein [Planctomycetota bacterium]